MGEISEEDILNWRNQLGRDINGDQLGRYFELDKISWGEIFQLSLFMVSILVYDGEGAGLVVRFSN